MHLLTFSWYTVTPVKYWTSTFLPGTAMLHDLQTPRFADTWIRRIDRLTHICCAYLMDVAMLKSCTRIWRCLQALTLRPEWSKAHYRLGSVLLSLGQPTEALDAIQTALLLQPHNKAATTLLKQAEDASRCHFRQQRQGTCEPVTSRPRDSEVWIPGCT